jgi:uncharacterized membrane protein
MAALRHKKIEAEIKKIHKKEGLLLNKLNKSRSSAQQKICRQVMHFTFDDFAQAVIGCCVFSLAPFLDTDPWNFLPSIKTGLLVGAHLFFMACVFIALNYEFRNNLKLNIWFLKLLIKRFFYTYFSVMMVVSLILLLVNRMGYSLTNLEVFRNFLMVQSVGLFGATTYSFLKK